MKKRPLLIWILLTLHLLEPIFKTFILGLMNETSLMDTLRMTTTYGLKGSLEYWLLFPIGGVALILMRNWSFWIFVGVQAYSIINLATYQITSLPSTSANPQLASLALVFANTVFLFYVFAPEVRDLFFDSHLRRWEARERHRLTIPCSLKTTPEAEAIDIEIKDISDTGAFVLAPLSLEREVPVEVIFKFYNLHYHLQAKIVSAHEIAGDKGLGIQFQFKNLEERLHLKRLIKAIELLGL